MQDATTSAYPNSAAPRIAWIDAMRGYSMILIVLGHSLMGLLNAKLLAHSADARSLVLFIYLFHMPLIFFVSGLVSKDHNRDVRTFFTNQFKWIVAPYFIWSIILILLQKLSPNSVNNPIEFSAILSLLWAPVSVFWFLYVFFWVKVADFAVGRLWKSPNVTLLLALISGVLCWIAYGPGMDETITRKLLCGLFFFELGRYASYRLDRLDRLFAYVEKQPSMGMLISIVGFVTLAIFSDVYRCQPTADLNPIFEFQRYIILTGTISLVPMILVSYFSAKFPIFMPVQLAGVYSMAIYVQHTLWGAGIRSVLAKIQVSNDTVYIVIITALGLALPVLWQVVTDRLRITPYFGIRPIKN